MAHLDWQLKQGTAGAVSPPLPMARPIWQILGGRGYQTGEQIQNLIAPQLKDLTPPQNLDGMDRATERLIAALENQELVGLYGDFDLDGTPGLALLAQGLQSLGFENLKTYQPKRLTDGYGFHSHLVRDFSALGGRLMVTVDVGITDCDTVEEANRLAIDVIITDHHLPKDVLPQALAIINPNKGTCPSGLGHLCGAGVAFYLILGLRKKMRDRGLLKNDFDPKVLLDLFSLGTITDMVPLIGENRVLVKHGLKALQSTQRPGLQALMENLEMTGRSLNSHDIAFRLAPRLNALSRLEADLLPLDVLMVGNKEEAQRLVAEIQRLHSLRQQFQRQAEKLATEFLKASEQQGYVWFYSEHIHRGIVGLVATQLSQKAGWPAFIASKDHDGNLVGSGRLPPGSQLNLTEILHSCSSVLLRFGGHAQAAGFELALDKAQLFDGALREYFSTGKFQVSSSNLERPGQQIYEADCHLHEIDDSFVKWFELLEPFGVGFEVPAMVASEAQIDNVCALKGGHLKYRLRSRHDGRSFDGLWFSPPPNHKTFNDGDIVDILFEPQWNHFRGERKLQLNIKDVRTSLAP